MKLWSGCLSVGASSYSGPFLSGDSSLRFRASVLDTRPPCDSMSSRMSPITSRPWNCRGLVGATRSPLLNANWPSPDCQVGVACVVYSVRTTFPVAAFLRSVISRACCFSPSGVKVNTSPDLTLRGWLSERPRSSVSSCAWLSDNLLVSNAPRFIKPVPSASV